MYFLDSYLLQVIFYFLDIDSLQECCVVSKSWKETLTKDSFWKTKFQSLSECSFHSGPYFKFSGHKTYLNNLNTKRFEISSFNTMKSISKKLENPQKLIINHINASSVHLDQYPSKVLNYDNYFWSSAPNDSQDSNEFLTFELKHESFIFAVSFKTFRESDQQGTVYSSKFVKLSIGYTQECSEFDTNEFEVGLTENYNTISILPKLVKGKFVKLHLIGKQSQETDTENWRTAIRFVEIVGYPFEYTHDPLLKLCRDGKITQISEVLSPFYFERLEKFGMVVKYLRQTILLDTDIACYMFEINKEKVDRPQFKPIYCEILGNYYFDKGEFKLAKKHYSRIIDVWGFVKVSIVTKHFYDVYRMVEENNSRRPGLAWVLKTARNFGGTELENIVAEELNEEIHQI